MAEHSHWLVPQLEKLSKSRPDRIDDILAVLKRERPEIFEEIVLIAIDHGHISRLQAAELLGAELQGVEFRLQVFRDAYEADAESQVIELNRQGVAHIAGKHVTVWEIVREYRQAGSVDEIRGAFPALTEGELRAALAFAGRNPDEIGSQILAYEEFVKRSHEAYPFARR
ncbi:MAG: DUF433 domain-containing protein [Chthonomonadaceae bacterium]|jgi:uncharacterized protein (DUF433 family)|nr:DUF433 domain-containing protein [Chthonomonadaceae bacterium]